LVAKKEVSGKASRRSTGYLWTGSETVVSKFAAAEMVVFKMALG